jgi:hypothetical protein
MVNRGNSPKFGFPPSCSLVSSYLFCFPRPYSQRDETSERRKSKEGNSHPPEEMSSRLIFFLLLAPQRFAIHGPLALLVVHLALQVPILAAFMQVRRPETSDPAGHGEGGDCARGDENARELGDARGDNEHGSEGDKMVELQSRGESSCPSSSSLQPLGGKGGNRY